MSNTKSVEQQLKEAVEASKQTLALSEQVTSLASEKEALSKRLAEIESALSAPKASEPVAVDPLIVAKLGELLAEREMTAKVLKEIQANVVRLEKEAAKKADLNEYVKQRVEEGEEGNTPAEKINNSGKKKGEMPQFIKDKIEEKEEEESEDEACNYKSKKGKKAGKAYEEEEELTEDEMEMLREYRNASKAKSKKADSTLKAPLKEEKKDFGDIIPQPGLDPNKNNVNEDNTTHPTLGKVAKKASKKGEDNPHHPSPGMRNEAKGETDVEEIMESPDMQESEGEEEHTHEKTLSEPAPGAKKGKKALESEAKKAGEDEIPAPLMEYLKQLVQQEKEKKETAKKGENALPGINKQDVVGQPDQDEEESTLEKKDAKKGKAKAESPETTKVHEDCCAPTTGNTTEVGDKSPLAQTALDSVVDVAVARLAEVAKAKQLVEAELAKKGETLASEIKAKDEALTAVAQLQAKFEAMMTKFAQAEASDKSLEAKAAKIVAQSVSEPVAAEIQGDAPITDADILAKFESLTDAREKNRYFKANATRINAAVQANLKRKVRS